MNKKLKIIIYVCLIAIFSLLLCNYLDENMNLLRKKVESKSDEQLSYDVVIYGGGTQAVSSAIKASEVTKDKKDILLIVPENKLGSILTVGGQNLYDVRQYTSKNLPEGLPKNYPWAQGGSMELFYKEPSIVFSPNKLADLLEKEIKKHSNIKVLYQHDIEQVYSNNKKKKIESVLIYPLKKDKQNRYIYNTEKPMRVKAPVFIDASETGKLTYISGLFNGIVGRADVDKDKKQMVATLMFKLKGIDMEHVQKHEKLGSPFIFYFSAKGSLGILGGYEINGDDKFELYSKKNERFRFKPYNGGEDGYAGMDKQNKDTEMWMNMFLVYDVDARKMWRDKVMDNGHYPQDGGIDPEIAREDTIKEMKTEEFISMIRSLPGLENAEFVLDENREPIVGEIMYLRESIHSSNEDGTFALTKEDTIELGDEKLYERRIGLGYYNFDSNTYEKGEQLSEHRTVSPWYVPYDVLVSTPTNLLIPGYAANMDSYTWRAMRVYPNLIVLGDAAGIAAGLYLDKQFDIKHPSREQLNLLQKELKKRNAILEK